MAPFLVEAAAVLLVAAIVATFGYASGKRSLQKRIDDAAVAYYVELDDWIAKSVTEGKFKAAANARELASRSQALRDQVEALRKPIEESFGEVERLANPREGENPDAMFAAITALQASWPAQRRSAERETRRLLGLLGIK
jgi:hypothetical protein